MNYSKGISWFDDCRIPFVDGGDRKSIDRSDRNVMMGFKKDEYVNGTGEHTLPPEQAKGNDTGRFPANLLCSDDMLNDGNIVKSSNNWSNKTTLQSPYFSDEKQQIQKDTSYNDKGTNSRYYDIDKWFNKLLDEL